MRHEHLCGAVDANAAPQRAADGLLTRADSIARVLQNGRTPVIEVVYITAMSYSLTLQCGCVVYVACHPQTHVAHTRIIELRGRDCSDRRHEIGARLYPWQLLPDPSHRAAPEWAYPFERLSGV
jgi:hypothetical protein